MVLSDITRLGWLEICPYLGLFTCFFIIFMQHSNNMTPGGIQYPVKLKYWEGREQMQLKQLKSLTGDQNLKFIIFHQMGILFISTQSIQAKNQVLTVFLRACRDKELGKGAQRYFKGQARPPESHKMPLFQEKRHGMTSLLQGLRQTDTLRGR